MSRSMNRKQNKIGQKKIFFNCDDSLETSPVPISSSTPIDHDLLPNGFCEDCNVKTERKNELLSQFRTDDLQNYTQEIEAYRTSLNELYKLCPRCDAYVNRCEEMNRRYADLRNNRFQRQTKIRSYLLTTLPKDLCFLYVFIFLVSELYKINITLINHTPDYNYYFNDQINTYCIAVYRFTTYYWSIMVAYDALSKFYLFNSLLGLSVQIINLLKGRDKLTEIVKCVFWLHLTYLDLDMMKFTSRQKFYFKIFLCFGLWCLFIIKPKYAPHKLNINKHNLNKPQITSLKRLGNDYYIAHHEVPQPVNSQPRTVPRPSLGFNRPAQGNRIRLPVEQNPNHARRRTLTDDFGNIDLNGPGVLLEMVRQHAPRTTNHDILIE